MSFLQSLLCNDSAANHPAIYFDGKSENGFQKLTIEDQCAGLYEIFPRHKGRAAAFKSIRRALKNNSFEVLRDAVLEYAKSREGEDPKFTAHPATWFNSERWADEPDVKKPKKQQVATDEDAATWNPNEVD